MISDEMVDAYVRAHDAVWQADAPISQGEAVATHRRAVRAGLEAALDLAHPFVHGGADSTFGAAGAWCAVPVGDDQCGLPPEAHTRTPRSQP